MAVPLFLGSTDGHLVAINANEEKVLWQTLVASPSDGYSIRGAPLVVNRSVVIGIAGDEFGIRGFLAAYDVSTGQQQWKFDTIPGPGEAMIRRLSVSIGASEIQVRFFHGMYAPATICTPKA